jgi:type IV secretory pathway VirB2 component (pilin)
MPSVIDSIGNLISSIFGAILSVFQGIFGVLQVHLTSSTAPPPSKPEAHIFQNILQAIIGVFTTLLAAIGTTISGLAQTFEGLLKFLLSEFDLRLPSREQVVEAIGQCKNNGANEFLGNILVIGVVVGGLFLYGIYMQKNGQSVKGAAKKTS